MSKEEILPTGKREQLFSDAERLAEAENERLRFGWQISERRSTR